ncbi:MAG: NADP-dependent oxidoreductase, partial [Bacteroidota bacterium]
IQGPRNYQSLLVHRARMEGFVVFDYQDRYMQAAQEMAAWMMAGKLKNKETIVEGIETFPDTMLRLFSGEKMGKLVLKA